MAKNFGGEFSPKGHKQAAPASPVNKFRGRKAHKSKFRSKLLFLAPLPLLFGAIIELLNGSAIHMVGELAALALLLLAAWLLREGLLAEEAFDARKVARKPAIPRKIFAAVLSGSGVFLAAFLGWQQGLFSSLTFGLLATGTHLFAFGLDPLANKGMDGVDDFENERVAKAVDKAEEYLRETLQAADRFGDRQLQGRVEGLATAARDMFRAVEQDPRDLTSARKFMSVYLRGARDATIKYADLNANRQEAGARDDYVALLDDLEASFAAQRDRMLMDDRQDLDIEIEVLRDRLKQKGARAGE